MMSDDLDGAVKLKSKRSEAKRRAANEEVAKKVSVFASSEECTNSPFDTLLFSLHSL